MVEVRTCAEKLLRLWFLKDTDSMDNDLIDNG